MKAVHGLIICEIIKMTSSKIEICCSSTLGSLSLIPKTGSTTRQWSSQMIQVIFLQTLMFGQSDQMLGASVSFRLRVCAQPETVHPQTWGRGVLWLPPAAWEGPSGSHYPICGDWRCSRAGWPPRRRPAAGSQRPLRKWPSPPWGRSFTAESSTGQNTIIHSFKERLECMTRMCDGKLELEWKEEQWACNWACRKSCWFLWSRKWMAVVEVLPLSQAVKSEMLRVLLESCLRAFRTF